MSPWNVFDDEHTRTRGCSLLSAQPLPLTRIAATWRVRVRVNNFLLLFWPDFAFLTVSIPPRGKSFTNTWTNPGTTLDNKPNPNWQAASLQSAATGHEPTKCTWSPFSPSPSESFILSVKLYVLNHILLYSKKTQSFSDNLVVSESWNAVCLGELMNVRERYHSARQLVSNVPNR